MNLETKVHKELWAEIKRSYTENRFTDAIKDAIVYLSETIRSKSGLEGDGVALVGQAFGGANPKIRVSKMESESDKNVQTGIEHILRGVFSSIRNPRHHGKINDSNDDADAIILFIDYLVRLIGKAKAQFSMDDCLRIIFDESFVESENYANLIVSEIPEKHRVEVFVEGFSRIGTGSIRKLGYFFRALMNVLTPAELDETVAVISKELRTVSPKGEISPILGIMRLEDWKKLDKVARLRTENALIASMAEGLYIKSTKKCSAGALGTWASNFCGEFELKDQAYYTLKNLLLSDDSRKHAYVNNFFCGSLSDLKEKPDTWDVKEFTNALNSGNEGVYQQLQDCAVFSDEEGPWVKPFLEPISKFKPNKETKSLDEEVPF